MGSTLQSTQIHCSSALILFLSTTTIEHIFLAMKLIETSLRNKMEEEILANCMILYIKRDYAEKY